MLKNINNKTLAIISFALFLIIYPYTKEIKKFRAEDINWDILNNTKKYKEFDTRTFSIQQTYKFSEDVLEMNGKKIIIKGFIKKDKHNKHQDIIITETVTDVCFMCNHDEHYNMIVLNPKKKNSKLYNIKDDSYIEVEGFFMVNTNKNAHSVYSLNSAELKEFLNGN